MKFGITGPSDYSDAALPMPAYSRKRTIAYWVVSLPVLAETALGIQWHLQRDEFVAQLLDEINFPHYFSTILVVSKILVLPALLVPGLPRLKEWAYAGLVFVYFGAAACHIAVHGRVGAILTPAIFGVITLASWALRPPSRRDPAPLPEVWARLARRSRTPACGDLLTNPLPSPRFAEASASSLKQNSERPGAEGTTYTGRADRHGR
jgi:hypothetical protein